VKLQRIDDNTKAIAANQQVALPHHLLINFAGAKGFEPKLKTNIETATPTSSTLKTSLQLPSTAFPIFG